MCVDGLPGRCGQIDPNSCNCLGLDARFAPAGLHHGGPHLITGHLLVVVVDRPRGAAVSAGVPRCLGLDVHRVLFVDRSVGALAQPYRLTGLTGGLRERLLDAAGDELIDARNRALLAVAYDTLLRRSELVALQVCDIVEEFDGAATVLVQRSKTDPEGRGATQYVAPDSVALVRKWLERSGVRDGKLFRSLCRGLVGEGLDASQVPRIFKAMAEHAGLPSEVVAGISGHSSRVGPAQDMVAGGIEMPAILQAGRWKTAAMVNRYAEHLLARRSGAAQLARLQHRG